MNETEHRDVVKALELCTSPERDENCPLNCPYGDVGNCEQLLMSHSLVALLENEAEIERLQAEIKHLEMHRECDIKAVAHFKKAKEIAKVTTIREFAERVKKEVIRIPQHHFSLLAVEECINRIAKKMKEEQR